MNVEILASENFATVWQASQGFATLLEGENTAMTVVDTFEPFPLPFISEETSFILTDELRAKIVAYLKTKEFYKSSEAYLLLIAGKDATWISPEPEIVP